MDTSDSTHTSVAAEAQSAHAPATAQPAAAAAAADTSSGAAAAAAASSPPAASASASASAPSASPTSAQDDADEDALINDDNIAEEDITGDATPAKKKRGRAAAGPAAPSTGPPADALERLNDLLRKTEQFGKFIGTTSAPEKKG